MTETQTAFQLCKSVYEEYPSEREIREADLKQLERWFGLPGYGLRAPQERKEARLFDLILQRIMELKS